MLKRRAIAVLLALAFGLAACGSGSDAAAPSADAGAGETAAGIVATTTAGGQIDFNSLEGTDTVLWFWAPW